MAKTFSPAPGAEQTQGKETLTLPYELMYIVRPTVDEQALAAVNEKIEKFITNGGGQLLKREDWGKRRLAYPIAKFTEGFYSVLQLDLPSRAVRDLDRSLKLTEEILRFLITRVESA
jgi:small subunit ribosomal protein S6